MVYNLHLELIKRIICQKQRYIKATSTLISIAYDHTTLRTRHPVRSGKLSNVGPDQYLDRRRPGNLGCCKLCFLDKIFGKFTIIRGVVVNNRLNKIFNKNTLKKRIMGLFPRCITPFWNSSNIKNQKRNFFMFDEFRNGV